MAQYLVTGVAGFIGRSIAAALLERGESVRGVDNFLTGKRANLVGLEAMEFFEGDLTDPAVCVSVCKDVEVIFHEAALPSVPQSVKYPLQSHQHCATATVNLLVAANVAGVRRVIYAGSSAVYGDAPELPKHEEMLPAPISPYAVAKLAGEYYMQSFARVHGMETVVLRYFNVFGPYQDPTSHYSGVLSIFSRMMLANEQPTIYGDGQQSRDFTYIDNVVQANLLAADSPAGRVAGQVINAATGEQVTLNQTYTLLQELTGYKGELLHAPARIGDIRDSVASVCKARELIGYRPFIDFRDGLRRTVEWYRMVDGASA